MNSVSVIVITFNSSSTIKDCLVSLGEQTLKDFEVVLVDNNSHDNTSEVVEYIKPVLNFPLRTFYLDRNIGFAGGNNFALKQAAGGYIALLNPDAMAENFWLEELIRAMDSHSEVGICASKIIDGKINVIDSAGDIYTPVLKGFKRGEGESSKRFNDQEYIFGACAGAALYRRKMIEEIGFLDDDFFLIHEDTDLNFRAQLSGWKVFYVPTAVVHHKVRSSIGLMSDTAIYYTVRNSEWVRIKNIPFGVLLKCIPDFLVGTLTEFLYFAVKHKHLKLYLKAKLDTIRMLSRISKKRAMIMRNKKVSNQYLLNLMTPIWQKAFLMTKIRKFFQA
jgi:GT2 family glycosyltransferase